MLLLLNDNQKKSIEINWENEKNSGCNDVKCRIRKVFAILPLT